MWNANVLIVETAGLEWWINCGFHMKINGRFYRIEKRMVLQAKQVVEIWDSRRPSQLVGYQNYLHENHSAAQSNIKRLESIVCWCTTIFLRCPVLFLNHWEQKRRSLELPPMEYINYPTIVTIEWFSKKVFFCQQWHLQLVFKKINYAYGTRWTS